MRFESRYAVAGVLSLCVALGWLLDGQTHPKSEAGAVSAPAGHPGNDAVEVQMRNVDLRLTRDIDLEVRSLRGRLKRTKQDQPVTFDDSNSFLVEIYTGEVAITVASLTALLNSHVFAYPGSPVKNVQVSVNGTRLRQKGTIHKGVDLPFEIEGPLSVTPEGNIRLHAEKIRSAHLPFKGLLHLFGADLSKLMNENAGRGVKFEGDDVILEPRNLTPPPHLLGQVTRVEVKDGRIVQTFGSSHARPLLQPPWKARSYIYHRGGVLRFGKLTMEDSDLEIVGDRTARFFNFFLSEYKKQLVAGYSKNTPANGLIVHMVDYTSLPKAR